MSKMSKEEVAALSEPSGGDSDDDNEGLGLVSKNDGEKRPIRKYYDRKKSYWCGCASRAPGKTFLGVLIGTTVVLVVTVVILVSAVVGLVTHQSGNVFREDGSKTESANVAAHNEEQFPWGNIRLQSSVVPETYDIHLTVDLDSFQVSGSVSIACSVQSSVSYIALHAVDMTITGHILRSDNSKVLEHNDVFYPENGFYIFNLTEPQEPGPIVTVLDFKYTLRDDLTGFYRSFYTDAKGRKQYLASTQFEPTDARKAFPCFDEPSLKANFSLQVTHKSRYKAWFNMPAVNRSQPDSSEMVTTHFQTSLRMSTYLVAFVVSDFQCIGDTMVSISGKEVAVRYLAKIGPLH